MSDQNLLALINYAAREDEVQARVFAEFADEARLEFQMLNAYLRGLETFSSPVWSDSWEAIALILVSRVFDSLDAAHTLVRRGYPLRAGGLIRTAEEDSLAWAYIEKFPNDAYFWREVEYGDPTPKPPRPPGAPRNRTGRRGMPNVKEMQEALGVDDPTGGAGAYGFLSILTHPRSTGLAMQLDHRGDRIYLRRGPLFHPVRTGLAYMALIGSTSAALGHLIRFCTGRNETWIDEVAPFFIHLGQWMAGKTAPSSRLTLQGKLDEAYEVEAAIVGQGRTAASSGNSPVNS